MAGKLNKRAIKAADRGDLDRAVDLFRAAVDAGGIWVTPNLARALAAKGRVSEAEAVLRQGCTADDEDSCAALADFLVGHGRSDEAAEFFSLLIANGNTDAMVDFSLVKQQQGDLATARQLLLDAIRHGDLQAHWHLGELEIDSDNIVEAVRHFELALEAGELRAHRSLGEVAEERGDKEAALLKYRLAIDAEDWLAALPLGLLLHAMDQSREAEALYREALANGSDDVLLALGNLIAEDPNRITEAVDLYQRAIQIGDVAEGNTNLGLLYLEAGQDQLAHSHLEAAAALGDPKARETLAELDAG